MTSVKVIMLDELRMWKEESGYGLLYYCPVFVEELRKITKNLE
jgi:hypothetical protein